MTALLFVSCVKDRGFNAPKNQCNNLTPTITFQELNNLYIDDIVKIHEDLILEGYIVSSDIASNFFGTIYIQDKAENPTMGIAFHVDLRDYYLSYPSGSKVFIKLKNLYLDIKNDAFQLGGVFSSFGNLSVGRLPSLQVQEHILLSCDASNVTPLNTNISALNDDMRYTLVQLDSLEFLEEDFGKTFAEPQEETIRILKDCNGNEIELVNSGYSDFQPDLLPENNGSVTGVLVNDGNDYQLQIRDLNDLNFANDRCPPIITEFTSNQIFISELADPENNVGARFIELYNAANTALSLNGWVLNRYTNGNTSVSSSIDLSAYTIEANSTFVISPNATEFESVYGFAPNMGVVTNSPADSNGDDNLELVDPFGVVIDVFGVIGEDGSGTNHEFEDGKAERNTNIINANATYTFSEWIVFNDTGASGTTNTPQLAPADFTPGVR